MKIKGSYLWAVILLALCIIACGCSANGDELLAGSTENQTAETEAPQETQAEILESQQTIYASVDPMTFEEYIANATHIVRAKYLGVSIEGNLAYLSFEPISLIRGTIGEESFAVVRRLDTIYTTTTGYRYTGDYSRYVEGEEYLLILQKKVSVYFDRDRYYILGDIFIPEAVSEATMFGRAELDQFSSTEDRAVDTFNEIVVYISELVKKNPTNKEHSGSAYVTSTDLREIADGSSYIFKIKVVEFARWIESNNTEWFYCEVSEQLKGVADKERIEIAFSADTVEIGEEYVVFLNKHSETTLYYILSSKNSVHPVTDSESLATIKAAIADEQQAE